MKKNFVFSIARYLPAILSGVLLTFSFPNANFPWLAWVALIPLLLSIRPHERQFTATIEGHNMALTNRFQSKEKEMYGPWDGGFAFKAGFWAGLVHYLSLLYWIVPTVAIFGNLPIFLAVPILVLLSCYLALYPALFAFFVYTVGQSTFFVLKYHEDDNSGAHPRHRYVYSWALHGMPLIAALAWVALEYLRSILFTGFPWGLLGSSQYHWLPLIQMADITAIYGISFMIVLTNGVLAGWIDWLFQGWRRKMSVKRGSAKDEWIPSTISMGFCAAWSVALILLFFIVLKYGDVRIEEIEAASKQSGPVSVAVIQGNIQQDLKWDEAYQEATLATYCQLSMAAVGKKSPALVVWPETALPFYYQWNKTLSKEVDRCIHQADTTFLVGSPAFERPEDDPAAAVFYNRAYMVNPTGFVTGHYDKIHLVPFGEYVPMGKYLSFLGKIIAQSGDFSPGPSNGEPLAFNGSSAGVLICFELIFPYLSRQSTLNGAELLVNTTNDAWFGRSSAPWQHFSMAVFRAVENRRAVARAANTGISGFVLPTGAIAATSKLFEAAHLTETLPAMTLRTWYTTWGDLFAQGCLTLTLVMVIAMVWPYVLNIFGKKSQR